MVTAAIAIAMASAVTLASHAGAATSNAYEPMPNVVGLGPASVVADLAQAQLYYRTEGPGANSSAWTHVVGEIPAAGTLIHPFSTVILVVSTSPVAAARPVTGAGGPTSNAYEPMPNVVGLGRASVVADLAQAQLYYRTEGPGANSSAWTHVVGEIPAAGTLIHPFSTVILVVSTSPVAAARQPVATSPLKLDAVTHAGPRAPAHATRSAPRTSRSAVSAVRVGIATWYADVPGRCATWYLPLGTRISVQDLSTGRVVRCVVTDREGSRGDHVVDLSPAQFAQLAPLSVGVVRVRVTW